QIRQPERRRDGVREAPLLEPLLNVAERRLPRRFAQQALERAGIGLEERARQRRQLDPLLLQQPLELLEQLLEVLVGEIERLLRRARQLADRVADPGEEEVEEPLEGREIDAALDHRRTQRGAYDIAVGEARQTHGPHRIEALGERDPETVLPQQ